MVKTECGGKNLWNKLSALNKSDHRCHTIVTDYNYEESCTFKVLLSYSCRTCDHVFSRIGVMCQRKAEANGAVVSFSTCPPTLSNARNADSTCGLWSAAFWRCVDELQTNNNRPIIATMRPAAAVVCLLTAVLSWPLFVMPRQASKSSLIPIFTSQPPKPVLAVSRLLPQI